MRSRWLLCCRCSLPIWKVDILKLNPACCHLYFLVFSLQQLNLIKLLLPQPYAGINLSIIPTNSTAEASRKIVQQRIDNGECIGYLSDSNFAEISGFSQVNLPPLETAPYGIALAKGRDELRRALSGASVDLMNQGDVSDIIKIENEYLVAFGLSPNVDVADMVAAISHYDFSDTPIKPASNGKRCKLNSGVVVVSLASLLLSVVV